MDQTAKTTLMRHMRDFGAEPATTPIEQRDAIDTQDRSAMERTAALRTRIAQLATSLSEVLTQESRDMDGLKIDVLRVSAERKEELVSTLESLWGEMRFDRAMAGMDIELRRCIIALSTAADRNLMQLKTLQDTMRHIAALRLQAFEEHSREGIYAKSGASVRPAELSPIGMALDL